MSDVAIQEQRAFKPKVHVKNGEVFTNSRDVAVFFTKRHDHILRDIDKLLKTQEEIDSVSRLPKFGETYVDIPIGGGKTRPFRTYDMDRKGFTILAMGFTGPKALEFKLRYIDAFDAMDEKLQKQNSQPVRAPFSPVREETEMINCHVNAVAEVRRIFGRAAARKLWQSGPLARLTDLEVDDCERLCRPEDDGNGCLLHLSRWAVGNGLTLGEMIRMGFDDEVAARALDRRGIHIVNSVHPPRFAVAERSKELEEIFALTPWADDWVTPLLALDRAEMRLTTLLGRQVRAVHIRRGLLPLA